MGHGFVGRLGTATGPRVRVNHDGTAPRVVQQGRVIATGWPTEPWRWGDVVVVSDHRRGLDELRWSEVDGVRHEGGSLVGDRSAVTLYHADGSSLATALLPSVTRARGGVRRVEGFDATGGAVAFSVTPLSPSGCGCGQ